MNVNSPKLPDLVAAKSMNFADIAKAINGFITDSKENKLSVSNDEIKLIQSLVDVLINFSPVISPHPGPKPIEPPPPELPFCTHLPGGFEIALTPEQETYNENYQKYRAEYEIIKNEWRENIFFPWEEAINQNYKTLNATEHRIIKGIRKEIDYFLRHGGFEITCKVPWKFLPPGFWPVDESSVANLFAGKSEKQMITERLISAVNLSPFEIVRGESEFNEYLCFRFRNNNKVLLESPYEGNAAYVLRGDWEMLSRKTKYELLNIYSEFCERIIHGQSGNWKYEIKRSLGLYR